MLLGVANRLHIAAFSLHGFVFIRGRGLLIGFYKVLLIWNRLYALKVPNFAWVSPVGH